MLILCTGRLYISAWCGICLNMWTIAWEYLTRITLVYTKGSRALTKTFTLTLFINVWGNIEIFSLVRRIHSFAKNFVPNWILVRSWQFELFGIFSNKKFPNNLWLTKYEQTIWIYGHVTISEAKSTLNAIYLESYGKLAIPLCTIILEKLHCNRCKW